MYRSCDSVRLQINRYFIQKNKNVCAENEEIKVVSFFTLIIQCKGFKILNGNIKKWDEICEAINYTGFHALKNNIHLGGKNEPKLNGH